MRDPFQTKKRESEFSRRRAAGSGSKRIIRIENPLLILIQINGDWLVLHPQRVTSIRGKTHCLQFFADLRNDDLSRRAGPPPEQSRSYPESVWLLRSALACRWAQVSG